MSNRPLDRRPPTDFERDHAELVELLSAVERPGADPAPLRAWLPAHFEREESGPFAAARRVTPELAGAFDALVAEHRAMLGALRDIGDGPDRSERIAALVAVLRDHERRESELVASVAYREIGAVD